ncbi:MAG: acyltransferase [Micromonosporaceae bacterium]|nr:acyltransferase [Micromonosporaceae bacterium]
MWTRSYRAFAARLDAATPAGRDRALDGLRALAIIGVVLGHWLVMALTRDPAGALEVNSPLTHLPALAPVTWLLQMLGLFFLVGGYTSARGYTRRTGGYLRWLRERMLRLTRPVVAAMAVLGAALPLLAFAGVPVGTLRTTAVLVLQPLWFVAVYAAITALTPAALALDRALRGWSALPAAAVVSTVDLVRYGPWQHAVPSWVGLVNLLPGWAFGFLLGVAWADGRITRRAAALLSAGGLTLALLLVFAFGYPVSMVGVPGDPRTNSHPPSLLVLALAAAQCGAAILLRDRLGALLRRPAWWAPVALLNLAAMTVFCWHQTALMLLSAGALAVHPAGLPGLHRPPVDLVWVGYRLAWLPAYLAVLAGLVVCARRFERPWRSGISGRLAVLALAAGFAGYAATAL